MFYTLIDNVMKRSLSLLLILFFWAGCSDNDDVIGWDHVENYGDERYKDYGENPFLAVADYPVSTFSVDADAASYTNARRYLSLAQMPPKESVRIEEYVNFFTYDYPEPAEGESVSINTEVSDCPWNGEHHLIRVGLKGKHVPEAELAASNYVLLIDVSGSMDARDKLPLLREGFKMMVDELNDDDRVAIVTYAGKSSVAMKSTPCSRRDEIKRTIDKLRASGSTAGADGILTAYEIAQENFVQEGNNRVILGTDGDFNVGPSSYEELVELIEEKRKSGVYLTVLGVGSDNLNDHMLEQIADKGNGNYEYIDNVDQLEKVFVHEKARFHAVVKDCKVQLTFNPNRVESYRLIGYENRLMDKEDFDDDRKDAGEIGVDQTVTALYEVKLKNGGDGHFAALDVRYKQPPIEQSRLLQHEIDGESVSVNQATENTRFAAAVVAFGLMMKQSEYRGTVSKSMILDLAGSAKSFDPHGYRDEFYRLVQKVKF